MAPELVVGTWLSSRCLPSAWGRACKQHGGLGAGPRGLGAGPWGAGRAWPRGGDEVWPGTGSDVCTGVASSCGFRISRSAVPGLSGLGVPAGGSRCWGQAGVALWGGDATWGLPRSSPFPLGSRGSHWVRGSCVGSVGASEPFVGPEGTTPVGFGLSMLAAGALLALFSLLLSTFLASLGTGPCSVLPHTGSS